MSYLSSPLDVLAELVRRLTTYIVGTPRLRTLLFLVLWATLLHLALRATVHVLRVLETGSLGNALAVTFALEVQ